jgi:hypothetical protein
MARYRIGETPETGGDHLTENLQTGAAVFGLAMGIGFVYAGLRGKQYWLAIWGAGLVMASLAYLGYRIFS